MPVKHSPPPVKGLYQRECTEPVLVMQGSSTTPRSNCLALAWPRSEPSNEERRPRFRPGGGGDRTMPLAEQRKDHTSLVVSPSGQTLVKVQSSYQGYFTPDNFCTRSLPGSSPTGGITIKTTPRGRRNMIDNKTGSFFSLKKSPSDSPQRTLTSPSYKPADGGLSPLALPSGRVVRPHEAFPPSSEKERRFERGLGGTGSSRSHPSDLDVDPSMESSGRDWSCGDGDLSTSSLHSVEGSPGWYLNGRIQGQRTGYKTDDGAFPVRSSPRWLCQRLFWWLATLLVIAILCINLSLFYYDYQAAGTSGAASKHVALKTFLKRQLIGQPIAVEEISSTLGAFLHPSDNRSAVVLSFHGGAGIGKSFTSDMIREYYFGSGDGSSICTSTFSVPIYSAHEVEAVREKIDEWLAVRDEACHLQLYVLEDLHGYTPCGIVSMLHENLESFLVRKMNSKRVVIIITNIATFRIMQDALYNLETNVKGNLNPLKFHSAIQKSWDTVDDFGIDNGAQNVNNLGNWPCDSGFKELSELIDVAIPFLPLQRQDVKRCAASIASRKGWTISREQKEWVADQLSYEPSHWPVFSSSGCKLVAEKLGLIHNLNVGKL